MVPESVRGRAVRSIFKQSCVFLHPYTAALLHNMKEHMPGDRFIYIKDTGIARSQKIPCTGPIQQFRFSLLHL